MDVGRFSRMIALSVGVLFALTISVRAADPPVAKDVAAQVDALFKRSAETKDVPSKPVGDEQFIRRVSLDLTGKLPSAEEVKAFNEDTAADKQAKLIDRLLKSDAYAINWGRYWRDTVTYQTPASGNY